MLKFKVENENSSLFSWLIQINFVTLHQQNNNDYAKEIRTRD